MSFNPNEHRDPLGRWASIISDLKQGETAAMADQIRVKAVRVSIGKPKTGRGKEQFQTRFRVTGRKHSPNDPLMSVPVAGPEFKSATNAARHALDLSAQHNHRDSLGGSTQYKNYEDWKNHQ